MPEVIPPPSPKRAHIKELTNIEAELDNNWARIEDAIARIKPLELEIAGLEAALAQVDPNGTTAAAPKPTRGARRHRAAVNANASKPFTSPISELPKQTLAPSPPKSSPLESTPLPIKVPSTASAQPVQRYRRRLAELRRQLEGLKRFRDARATQRNSLWERREELADTGRRGWRKGQRKERGRLLREVGVDLPTKGPKGWREGFKWEERKHKKGAVPEHGGVREGGDGGGAVQEGEEIADDDEEEDDIEIIVW